MTDIKNASPPINKAYPFLPQRIAAVIGLFCLKNPELAENVTEIRLRRGGALSLSVSDENITPDERKLVWGIFGKNDRLVNCQTEFTKAYGRDHFKLVDGEHSLTQTILKRDVLPIILKILA